jgi:signal transduction histidine kinase
MTYLLYILIIILLLGVVFFYLKNRQLTQELQEKKSNLIESRTLLLDTLSEQEATYQQVSETLHSSISSKLYAIDLALYSLKKNIITENTYPIIQNIKTTTQATLQSIQHLANELSSPTLSELGLLPALEELADQYPIEIQANTIQNSLPSALSQQIYRVIKHCIHESMTSHEASQIQIEWRLIDQNWELIYSDNGNYNGTCYKKSHIITTRLSLIRAHIQSIQTTKLGMQVHIVGKC